MYKIAIHSVPRSGSSWLGQIFNSSPSVAFRFQPLFSYSFKSFLDERSSRSKILQFFDQIARSDDPFIKQLDSIRVGSYPSFSKSSVPTHIVYKEVRYHYVLENLLTQLPEVRVIGMVRNPMAVINSWMKAPREFRKDLGWSPKSEWRAAPAKNQGRREEYFGFEKWKQVARLFCGLRKRFPLQFYLLSYRDLLQSPIGTAHKLFKFSSLGWSDQTERFLNESQTLTHNSEYSVYRKKNGLDDLWKRELDHDIVSIIERELADTDLEKFLT